MSSVKYDEAACDNVAKNLNDITYLLSEVNGDLNRLINCLPTSDRIDNRILQKSTKTRTKEDGSTEEYIDYDTKSYYERNYKTPIINAKNNISKTAQNVRSLKSSVETIDDKVKGIQDLIGSYEETKIGKHELNTPTVNTINMNDYKNPNGRVDVVEGPGKTKLNVDTDGDGIPDLNIDVNGDGKADLNVDTNNDGKPDVNIDTNGDGKADLNVDVDNDGAPDYNIDTNGDGKADLNVDTNNDGKPNYNIDLNGDGTADLNIDTNNDGEPDLNIDLDGDGKADLNIDTDNDGKPDINIDKNGDGEADLNIDKNHDGKPTINIDTNDDGKADINIDTNGDGKADVNIDTDGDGKADKNIDKNGDGKVDKTTPTDKDTTGNNEDDTTPNNGEESDLFKEQDAENSEDGFADNIVAGVTTDSNSNSTNNNSNGGAGSIWGTNAEGNGEGGLFPFLPGSSTSSDGENPDFIYRGLYDQSGDGDFDMNQIKYNAMGQDGTTVSKGAAIAGAVGLGVSGVDAVATLNENRKQDGTALTPGEEKEDKKLIKTIVSSSILGIVSIGYIIALLVPNASIFAIILLGVAMAISSITATSGLKIGKYIGFGVTLFVALLTFILTSLGVISPIGYVVVFATFVILSIASFLLDLLKGMFDDKLELVPIIIAIAVGLFFGMLKVLDIINWIVLVLLIILTIGGYFLWDKVIKNKLPDDDDDDEIVDNVIYKPVKYTENSPMNAHQEEAFDPRSLYQEEENKPALESRMNNQNQNPFANYNPKNSSFDNAFNNDNNNNNNGNFNGMF